MAYNALSGTILGELVTSPALSEVSISNNFMTGTIPSQLGDLQLGDVFLSYNKFVGQFRYNATVQSYLQIYAEYNRLSGAVDLQLAPIGGQSLYVHVLAGNIFACNSMRSDIPSSDADASTYQCGSDNYNTPYYGWLFVSATCAAVLLTTYICKDKVTCIFETRER